VAATDRMRELLEEYREIERPRNVGLISLAHGINEFYGIAIPPIIPILVADLGITYGQAGLLLTVFFVMYSVFQLPAGLLADRVGKKRLLVWGLVGMAGALALASTADGYGTLVLAQVLMGISGSTYHPAGMSLISDIESQDTEGKAMGVFGLGGMVGIASAPVVIGGIASLADWRTALLVAAVLGVAVTAAFQLLYREPGGGRPTPVADGGRGDDAERPRSGDGRGDDAGGLRSDGGRGTVERARDVFRRVIQFEVTPGIVVLTIVVVLVSLQIRSIQTFATGFLADGVGRSTSAANAVFFVMLAASAVSSIWVGSLADRYDRGRLGALAAGITSLLVVSTAAFVAADGAVGEWLLTGSLVVVFAVLGLALYACTPIKNALMSEYATRDSSGSLFGVTQTASSAGSAAGPAIFGYVATEGGIGVAFPLIASVGLVIAVGFYTLSWLGGP